jgi:long-subunit fatty acid transport protein
MVLASDFFTAGATTLNGLSSSATTLAGTINTAIGGGTPATTPLSAMPAPLVAGVTQVLGAAGINAAGMNIGTAAATLTGVAPVFTDNATQMTGYATATSDIEVDAEETGMGYSPMISVNISPVENLNISVKYEFRTKLELTTSLAAPNMGAGIFIQDEKKRADMPAMLSVGANLKLSKLTVAAGGNYYFDKSADFGHKEGTVHLDNSEIIENNGLALHAGAELNLSDKFLVSAGYAWANLGVNSRYQSDLTFANATSTIGLGGAYNITDKIRVNLGGGYTMYVEDSKTGTKLIAGTTDQYPTETFTKNTMMLGIGLDLSF